MVTVRGDKIEKNRYWGVALDQGYAVVSKNTIKGEPGLAGIQAVQYGTEHQFTGNPSGQQFGVRGTGAEDEISEEVCAVEGFSDNLVSDQPGSVKLTASLAKIAGKNTKTVCNNNTTGLLTIDVK
jgi:hypothetical protein